MREFKGCAAAVNKVVNATAAVDVGRGVLGLMLYVSRVAQAQLVLGCLQDLRGAIKRTQKGAIDEVACKDSPVRGYMMTEACLRCCWGSEMLCVDIARSSKRWLAAWRCFWDAEGTIPAASLKSRRPSCCAVAKSGHFSLRCWEMRKQQMYYTCVSQIL